jgi:hypothetical protein
MDTVEGKKKAKYLVHAEIGYAAHTIVTILIELSGVKLK